MGFCHDELCVATRLLPLDKVVKSVSMYYKCAEYCLSVPSFHRDDILAVDVEGAWRDIRNGNRHHDTNNLRIISQTNCGVDTECIQEKQIRWWSEVRECVPARFGFGGQGQGSGLY